MWYFIIAMVINGVASVNVIPAKDLADCRVKAGQLQEMIKADKEINQPQNIFIYSCKQIQTS